MTFPILLLSTLGATVAAPGTNSLCQTNFLVRIERINSYYDESYNNKEVMDGASVRSRLFYLAAHLPATNDFYICHSRAQIEAWASRIGVVKDGDDIDAVAKSLGTPTYRFPRSIDAKDYSKGVCLKYYMVKRDLQFVDDTVDMFVALYFSKEKTLEFIYVSNALEMIVKQSSGS